MNELERYLTSEAAQGLFVDEGGFQLDPEEALKKLSLFALPDPGMWVLKMLQAAVAVGAPEIRFTFERRLVRVEFDNIGQWKAGPILSQLLSGQTPQESARRHLVSGILGAATGFSETLVWGCGGELVRVGKAGTSVTSAESFGLFWLIATRPRAARLSAKIFSSPLRYLFRQTADEYKALIEHGQVTPIPVIIDKYRFEGSYQIPSDKLPKISGYHRDTGDDRCMIPSQFPVRGVMPAQFPVRVLDRAALPYPVDGAPVTGYEKHSGEEKLSTFRLESNGEAEAVVCLHWCLQKRSRLNLVMDGVLLERRVLFDDPSLDQLRKVLEFKGAEFVLDIYLSVSWDHLDLSQFHSREEYFNRQVTACLPELRRVLRHLIANASKDWDFSSAQPIENSLPSLSLDAITDWALVLLVSPVAVALVSLFFLTEKMEQTSRTFSERMSSDRAKARAEEIAAFRGALGKLLKDLEGMELRLEDHLRRLRLQEI